MKLQELLTEAVVKPWEMKELTVKKAIQFLNANCKDGLRAIKNTGVLFRGDKNLKSDFVILDSTNSHRTSKDYNNIYQLMMDNSASMAKFPSRSNSFICTSSLYTAQGYSSNAFAVIPLDGTKIVVSNEADFAKDTKIHALAGGIAVNVDVGDIQQIGFNLFPKQKTYKDINALDAVIKANALDFLIHFARQFVFSLFTTDVSRIISHKQLATLGIKESDLTDTGKILYDIIRKDGLTGLANFYMTPENLSLELKTFGHQLPEDVECWFSGKAVFIHYSVFLDILEEMVAQGMEVGDYL